MKKGLVLFAALFAIGVFPALVQAQGLLGFGLPGISAGPGGPGVYDASARPFLTPPNFYMGWMVSAKDATFSPDFANVTGLVGGHHKWPTAGLWLGLEEKANLTENCGLTVDGWFLVPATRRGTEGEEETRSFLVNISTTTVPNFVTFTSTTLGGRAFDTTSDWWYIDAMGSCGCSKNFQVLAGFRYEHFSTRWINPQDAIAIPSNGDDRADITINSYLPFFGVQYNVVGSTGSINLRIIGFPYVPADVTHFESGEAGTGTRVESTGNLGNKSGFLEAFAQTSVNLSPNASAGAFVRWNWLWGRGYLHSEVQPGTLASSDDLWIFERMGVTVGGSVSLGFTSPF